MKAETPAISTPTVNDTSDLAQAMHLFEEMRDVVRFSNKLIFEWSDYDHLVICAQKIQDITLKADTPKYIDVISDIRDIACDLVSDARELIIANEKE